jgi:cbb3-type cytochrome oxidase maturation protein
MTVVLLLIPLALLLAGVALCSFLWGVSRGQFDDLTTPSRRMLHDDVPAIRQRLTPSLRAQLLRPTPRTDALRAPAQDRRSLDRR